MTAHQCNSPGLYPVFLPTRNKGAKGLLQFFWAVVLSLPALGSGRVLKARTASCRPGTASPHLCGHLGLPGRQGGYMRSWGGGGTSFRNLEHAFNGRRHTPPLSYPPPHPRGQAR